MDNLESESVKALRYSIRHTYIIQFFSDDEALISVSGGDPVSKLEYIEKIRDYCDYFIKNKTQSDLDEICRTVSEIRKEKSGLTKKEAIGNVYIMLNNKTLFTKIGFTTKEPKYREKTLRSEEPDIKLIKYWPNATLKDEMHLHYVFSKKKVRGEWFDLSQEDIEKIENYFSSKEVVA